MRKISSKLMVLLVVASLLPLLTFGLLSLTTSRRTATKLAAERNRKVAQRAAEEIALYLETSSRILKALAANINRTNLSPWQKEALLKDYILEFKEFQTIYLLDSEGDVLQTSSITLHPEVPKDEALLKALEEHTPYRSGVFITDELLPTISLGFPVEEKGSYRGMVLGVVNLLDVWNVVDQIKVGQRGFALVVSEGGTLLAHGDPKHKPLVIEQRLFDAHPLLGEAHGGPEGPVTYKDKSGTDLLIVGIPIPGTDWALYIDQPLEEAYIDARTMTKRLSLFIVVFAALASAAGFVGGRRYVIEPIRELTSAARAFARGAWERRVGISSRDEFGELGGAFNSMAGDLEKLKEDIQRKEREATLGRIAGGLLHDLKHPIKNIENMAALMPRLYEDEEFRATFLKTVERELETINRYFEDLADVATDKPLQRVELELAPLLGSLLEELRLNAEAKGINVVSDFPAESSFVSADLHALRRVFSNLANNALEALPEGGTLKVSIRPSPERGGEGGATVDVSVEDTGAGIPPEIRDQLFEPFFSTKRKGLGLGLSIAKKLTESHGGSLRVESSPGRGTAFIVTLPLLNG